jgi:hypothetical protein
VALAKRDQDSQQTQVSQISVLCVVQQCAEVLAAQIFLSSGLICYSFNEVCNSTLSVHSHEPHRDENLKRFTHEYPQGQVPTKSCILNLVKMWLIMGSECDKNKQPNRYVLTEKKNYKTFRQI